MIAKALLLIILILTSGCSAAHVAPVDYGKAKLTAHRLVIDVTTTCSATAVGPNAILTATHCLDGAVELFVGGTKVEWSVIADDGNDHVLVRTDLAFKYWAKMGPAPKQGDSVFLHGNPSVYADILRIGYYAGDIEGIGIFDLEATKGDSGAAMFDKSGKIVGMLSAIQILDAYTMALSFEFRFTAEQWKLAAT